MSNLTAPIATTTEMDSPFGFVTEFIVKSGATIYQGSGVAIGSDGYIVHSSQASALYTLGRAEQTVVGDGTLRCRVKMGVMRYANDAGHLLSIANRLGPCYWTDDQTVGTDSSKLLAGVVIDADASWAYVLMGATMPGSVSVGALLAANNLNDVASAITSLTNIGGEKRYLTLRATDVVGANAKRYGFVAPAAGNITKVRTVLLGAALTTGDCTLTGKINTVAITNGVVTVTQSGSAIGDVDSATPSAARAVVAGDFVEFLVGGTNAQTTSFVEIMVELTLT